MYNKLRYKYSYTCKSEKVATSETNNIHACNIAGHNVMQCYTRKFTTIPVKKSCDD